MLETGPDEQMGIFGRLRRTAVLITSLLCGSTDGDHRGHHTVAFTPDRAGACQLGVSRSAAAFVLNSGLCTSRSEGGTHADVASLIGINGRPFDIGRIDIETKLGTAEIWEVISVGMAHPFHVHGALFRVLSIEEKPPPAHLAGWKDTLLVEDKAELLVAFDRPASRTHPFMFHCHILEHEEAGLMGQYICA